MSSSGTAARPMDTREREQLEGDLEGAWDWANAEFPFEGYIKQARKSGYIDMVRRVAHWTGRDVTCFDFGAGPCDKTAVFARVGMQVTAYDDLQDAWHREGDNRQKILDFAAAAGIEYRIATDHDRIDIESEHYDMVMSHDVLEHLHSSPRLVLNALVEGIKDGGILAITVPNAVNLRKRLDVLRGRTNYPKFEYFYWYPGVWRGHVREYTRRDLELTARFMGLELLDISGYSLQLDVLPAALRRPFHALTAVAPGLRDSWLMVCRKPAGWKDRRVPTDAEFDTAYGNQYYAYSKDRIDWSE